MAITRRLIKGSPLTAAEHDANVDAFDKYKGRYANLAAINTALPTPEDADYAYSTSGTLRFYAIDGTWQSEVLSFTPPTAAEQYADTQELVSEQANQVDRATYEVVDASDDPAVVARGGSSNAHYRYLGVAIGDLTAYELLPATEVAQPEFNAVVDLGNVSGNVTIDWDTAIKYKMRLIGNTTLVFSNFAAYEGIKVQELEIYSDSNAYTLTFPSGVDLDDISRTPIDFALTTTGNHLSFRVLNSTPYFQTANYVKIV